MSAPTPWPRLSADLKYLAHPGVCRACGRGHDAGAALERWQECDAQDQPEPIIVVLCGPCAKKLIGPHPRLYRRLMVFDPWPGCMPLCVGCTRRTGTRCAHPDLKANGGLGLSITIPKGTPVHLNYGGGRGEFRTMYPHWPTSCAGRQEVA